MTKVEKARMEALLTEAALRRTSPVEPDVIPPHPQALSRELSTGFAIVGELSDSARVEVACSSSVSHAVGYTDRTTTQNPKALYSTRLRALRALRYKVEARCAALLRKIDRWIEEETQGENN
jgi:hypothetical protein